MSSPRYDSIHILQYAGFGDDVLLSRIRNPPRCSVNVLEPVIFVAIGTPQETSYFPRTRAVAVPCPLQIQVRAPVSQRAFRPAANMA